MRIEKRAETFKETRKNFRYYNLKSDSIFYVDVNEARNGKNSSSKRDKLIQGFRDCIDNEDEDEYQFLKQLFIGHKACGKTTELHKIEDDLKKNYYIVYVSDIEKHEDRISSQIDFLYFIMEKILENCNENSIYRWEIQQELTVLQKYLEEKIFGEVVRKKELDLSAQLEIEAEASVSTKPFIPVIKLLAKLGGKSTFAKQTNETITISIKNNFDEFLEIANSIITKIQNVLLKEKKMLLLILDGLDKIKESSAEAIFLDTSSFLTQLKCSMIVTFPIYLLYSPRKNDATSPFDGEIILSMIKTHERNGEDCIDGINALKSIVDKRMNIDKLFEKEEDLLSAIRLSGGNIRDLFRFIRDAASEADLQNSEVIDSKILETVFRESKSEYKRLLTKEYLPYFNIICNDTEKNSIIRKDPHDNTLLNMFNSGLLIEYNGERWCDLHPLVKEIVENTRLIKESGVEPND